MPLSPAWPSSAGPGHPSPLPRHSQAECALPAAVCAVVFTGVFDCQVGALGGDKGLTCLAKEAAWLRVRAGAG